MVTGKITKQQKQQVQTKASSSSSDGGITSGPNQNMTPLNPGGFTPFIPGGGIPSGPDQNITPLEGRPGDIVSGIPGGGITSGPQQNVTPLEPVGDSPPPEPVKETIQERAIRLEQEEQQKFQSVIEREQEKIRTGEITAFEFAGVGASGRPERIKITREGVSFPSRDSQEDFQESLSFKQTREPIEAQRLESVMLPSQARTREPQAGEGELIRLSDVFGKQGRTFEFETGEIRRPKFIEFVEQRGKRGIISISDKTFGRIPEGVKQNIKVGIKDTPFQVSLKDVENLPVDFKFTDLVKLSALPFAVPTETQIIASGVRSGGLIPETQTKFVARIKPPKPSAIDTIKTGSGRTIKKVGDLRSSGGLEVEVISQTRAGGKVVDVISKQEIKNIDKILTQSQGRGLILETRGGSPLTSIIRTSGKSFVDGKAQAVVGGRVTAGGKPIESFAKTDVLAIKSMQKSFPFRQKVVETFPDQKTILGLGDTKLSIGIPKTPASQQVTGAIFQSSDDISQFVGVTRKIPTRKVTRISSEGIVTRDVGRFGDPDIEGLIIKNLPKQDKSSGFTIIKSVKPKATKDILIVDNQKILKFQEMQFDKAQQSVVEQVAGNIGQATKQIVRDVPKTKVKPIVDLKMVKPQTSKQFDITIPKTSQKSFTDQTTISIPKTRTTESFNVALGQSQAQSQKQMLKQMLDFKQPSKQNEIFGQDTGLRLKQDQSQKQTQRQLFRFRFKPIEDITGTSFKITPRDPFNFRGFPAISLPSGTGGRKKKRDIFQRSFFRTPSFASVQLGRFTDKPSKLEITGLVERPIIRKKKKKKKRK